MAAAASHPRGTQTSTCPHRRARRRDHHRALPPARLSAGDDPADEAEPARTASKISARNSVSRLARSRRWVQVDLAHLWLCLSQPALDLIGNLFDSLCVEPLHEVDLRRDEQRLRMEVHRSQLHNAVDLWKRFDYLPQPLQLLRSGTDSEQ